MDFITSEIIREIAEKLDCGFRAFIHKKSGKLLFVPNEDNLIDIDLKPWKEDFKELKKNAANYYEIDRWTTREAFDLMCDFAEQLTDIKLQNKLFDALENKKPFGRFKMIIDNSGKYRQQWFDFKKKWQQDYVARQLNILKSLDE